MDEPIEGATPPPAPAEPDKLDKILEELNKLTTAPDPEPQPDPPFFTPVETPPVQDPSYGYDPEKIVAAARDTATADAVNITMGMQAVMSDLEGFSDLSSQERREIVANVGAMAGTMTAQGFAQFVKNDGHKILARAKLGEKWQAGKLEKKQEPVANAPTPVGTGGRTSDDLGDRAVAEYEKMFGSKPTKEAEKRIRSAARGGFDG